MIKSNGMYYKGEWLWGKRKGKGVLRELDGSVYSGNFWNDWKHGVGVREYVDGRKE